MLGINSNCHAKAGKYGGFPSRKEIRSFTKIPPKKSL